jgi:exopolysaccharide production protein ExoQ
MVDSGNVMAGWSPRLSSGPSVQGWTAPAPQSGRLNAALGRLLLFILLAFALIGTRPFSGTDIDSASSASDGSLNQVIWLGSILLAAPLILMRFRLALAIARQAWPVLLVMAWATATAYWSPLPDLTLRRVIVLWLMYGAALGVAVSEILLWEFHRLAMLVTGVVMAVDVLGAIGMPSHAINSDGQLVGMHGHKNSAGQAAVLAAICWYFFAARYRWNLNRLCILAASAFFYLLILATGSKTGSALAFLVMAWCTLWAVLLRKGASVSAICWTGLGFIVLMAIVTLIVSGATAADVGMALFGDLTFTGRWQLWEVIWDQIAQHFWLGYGFGAFWDVDGADNSFGLARSVGWLGVVGQAHNGYLDLFLQIGLVGLGLALLSLGWSIRLAHRLLRLTPRHPFDTPARAFAYAMILSVALYNLLESSYFRPHHLHAIWLFLILPIMQRELLEAQGVSPKAAARHGPPPIEARREPFL